MYKKYFIPFCLSLFYAVMSGQQKSMLVIDSLKNKSYQYLEEKLGSDELGQNARKAFSTAYLEKAKNEKNWEEMVSAYKAILHQSEKRERIVYADSMIIAAKHTGEKMI
jgi:DNA-binding NtrC family response regulator